MIRRMATKVVLALGLCGMAGSALAASAAVQAKIEPALLSAVQLAGESDFVIFMQQQADLSAAASQKTRADKGRVVVAALKAQAASSQAGVLAELAARGLEHRSFWIANAITARGSLADIQALAARADVQQLLKIDTRLPQILPATIARMPERPTGVKKASAPAVFDVVKALGDTAEAGVKLINAPAVWAMGFKGQGVVVGDHDVGVMWDHPALKKNYRGWDGTTANHAYNWHNAFGALDLFCTDPVVPCDSNGHGTHTTGTMVGIDGDNQVGVAPESKWMACRSLLDPVLGVGTVPTYMDCMQWQLAPYPEGEPAAADPAMAPDVISNSWGCLEGCAPPILKATNDAIYAAGQVQVVSAGNDGNDGVCSTVAFPLAVYESSFSVGASDVGDEMAGFSSLGPVLTDASLRLKPNVTAPGVDTRSSWNDGDYNTISGTSMAGPHVAGMVALIMSSEPRLIGRVADIRLLVERTANPDVGVANTAATCGGTDATTIPNNIFGYGRIDALAAVVARPQLAVSIDAPASAALGTPYTATVKVSQPDTGKIDVTAAKLNLTLPSDVRVVSQSSEPVAVLAIDGTTSSKMGYVFDAGTLAPGAIWQLTLTLQRSTAGPVQLESSSEADQVSLKTGPVAKTEVGGSGAGSTSDTPVAGRFGGGSFGFGVLALLGFGALRRRKRS